MKRLFWIFFNSRVPILINYNWKEVIAKIVQTIDLFFPRDRQTKSFLKICWALENWSDTTLSIFHKMQILNTSCGSMHSFSL